MRLAWPIGPEEVCFNPTVPSEWYIATHFLESYQINKTRSYHPGIDLNLRTGGDSDLGRPVFASYDGRVLFAAHFPTWGNVILIEHGNGFVYTQYAHLLNVYVAPGDIVRTRNTIGTIGKGAQNRYLAHLHYEIRRENLAPNYWPGTKKDIIKRAYLDPQLTIGRDI